MHLDLPSLFSVYIVKYSSVVKMAVQALLSGTVYCQGIFIYCFVCPSVVASARGVPKIKVNFKETATGVVRNDSVTIQCQQSNPFSLKFVDDGRWSGQFRPGMPLKGMVGM